MGIFKKIGERAKMAEDNPRKLLDLQQQANTRSTTHCKWCRHLEYECNCYPK